MTVRFPAIKPTAHDYVAPRWPVTESVSQSGVRSTRLWGSLAGDGGMTLTFQNIANAAAAQIFAAHTAAKGRIDDVSLPAVIFQNIDDPELLEFLRTMGPGLRWYFAAEPQGSRVAGAKRQTVRVELRAELRL
jgi:hypothetical protein